MNVKFPNPYRRFLPLVFLGSFLCAIVANAAEPNIQATLSDSSTEVGQSVDLQIEITGAQKAEAPSGISVDGLNFGSVSKSVQQRFNFTNGAFTSSSQTIYSIPVIPQRSGTFTIPAITLEADGKKISTKPLTLTVGGGGAGQGTASAQNAGDATNNSIAFAELIVPRENVYVGEAIPVEVRIYLDARVRVRSNELPEIKSEGFTVQKFPQPHQEQIQKNGRLYNFVTFKTAVTPVKSGKLALGPATMNFIAQVPQQRRNRGRGGIDDPFGDEFFNGMFNQIVEQPLAVKSSGIDLEVKPLPKQNQPANFSGAVGEFSLATEASPLKLNIGDPITLKLKVTGRGNFDLVSAPHMADQDGWRSYPPSSKFAADDDIGISGSKTFEMAVIPEEKKTKLPVVEFSYFDPRKEKYVTLTADRMSINVEGQGQQAPVAQATPAIAQPQATPGAANEPGDIHYLLTGAPHWGKSFTPVFMTPIFWKAQGAPMLVMLAFIGFQITVRRKQDVLARQQAERRRRKGELLKIIQDGGTDLTAFYDAATQYVQVEAARSLRRDPSSIGSVEVLSARSLDSATAEAVQSLFNTHGELAYAGSSAPRQKVSSDLRQSVLATLKKFENASDENV